MSDRRPRLLALAPLLGALAAVALIVASVGGRLFAAPGVTLPPGPTPLPTGGDPVLPDLVMLPFTEFVVANEEDGDALLRFTAAIANVGDGPLWIRADRESPDSGSWSIRQRMLVEGGFVERAVEGVIAFGGHGHNHWHVRSGASYVLTDPDAPAGEGELRSQTKAGFCFFDQVPLQPTMPSAAAEPVFDNRTCGERNWIEIEMGMSVGWSDPYQWTLADQAVDVTGLPDGRYRLEGSADPDGWFEERDESNNATWAIVELFRSGDLVDVRVVESAPGR